jgi:hypothetical protein
VHLSYSHKFLDRAITKSLASLRRLYIVIGLDVTILPDSYISN